MNDVIVYDAGKDADKRYTILYGGMKAFIVGEDAVEDHRNIEVVSRQEVDVPWMDKNYKRIPSTNLPESLIAAIRKRA